MSTPNVPQQPHHFTQQQPGQPMASQQNFTAPGAGQYAPQHPPTSKATTLDKTNTFALLAIVLAFLSPVAAIVFGHLGLNQIKRTGDAGRGIALTGLILGYVYAVTVTLLFVTYIGMIVVMLNSFGSLGRMY